MRYRPEIDGLRAVAVIPVILFHAGFGAFGGGFVGVDVFFVISGFLITSLILGELDGGRFSLLRFYERRARRILPALFVVMLACLPFAYLWMSPSQLQDFAQSLIAVVLFGSNLLFWQEQGYFAAAAELKPLLHTWSLAVEEQYYLVFPLFLLAIWRSGRDRAFRAVVAIAVLSLALSEWGWRNSPGANFYLLPTRAWELLAGSICAFLYVGSARRPNGPLAALGLAMIVAAIFIFDEKTPFPSLYALVPVTGTALILLFASENSGVARVLSLRPVVAVGLVSYSAYLWHQPLFAFARLRSLGEPAPILMGGLAVAALGLAWLSWRFIEQPFRRRDTPLLPARRQVFAASAAAATLIAAIGAAGQFGKGFHWRISDADLELYATAIPSPKRGACHYDRWHRFAAEDSCIYPVSDARVAVYGDSHGVELAYVLAAALEPSERALVHFTISQCFASYGRTTEPYCDDFYQSRLDYVMNAPEIEDVVLAFRAEDGGRQAADAIVDLANFLDGRGKHVVLVLQAPRLEVDVSNYLMKAVVSGQRDVPSISRGDWSAVNAHVYDALPRLRAGVAVVDLADAFCYGDTCFAVRDGEALYFDDDHMSLSGAARAAPLVLDEIGRERTGAQPVDAEAARSAAFSSVTSRCGNGIEMPCSLKASQSAR
ncbi:MAG: acyltransferase family protein [Paracoccaceae bacterium]|nr:acyltransferase family protein [Paracoccaceae bacterium]